MENKWPKCTGNQHVKTWKNEKGQLHREDGPALISWKN
jgi:hypothetical protein